MMKFDVSIIRPQMAENDIKQRGQAFSERRLDAIRKGLLALHTLELMAQTIYKFQITKASSKINSKLIAAMCNEMTHYQDFQIKLYEYNFKPSIFRAAYWFVGFIMGYTSRLRGPKAILKTGIWVETKAVNHYKKLLETIEWDEDTRAIIVKDQADEQRHIETWKRILERREY